MTDTTAAVSDNGTTAATITGSAVDPASASTGAATGANASTQTASTQATTGIEWLNGADELAVGYAQNKGWKSPVDMLSSYQNLEKLMGADRAGNTVVLPGENATPEEIGKFFDRMGRPSDAAGYNIQVPEKGGDPEFAKIAASKFHELGLTTKQGQELSNWWNETVGNQMATQESANLQNFQADEAALKAEWGAAHDQNVVIARNVANTLGLDAGTIDKLQASLGHKGVMEMLVKIGSRSGEDKFTTGGNQSGFGSAMTPAQAKAEISSLMNDKNFTARYLNKDAEAVAKMAQLHQYAFPEE